MNKTRALVSMHCIVLKTARTPWVPLTKAKMTSLPVFRLTPNFLTMYASNYVSQSYVVTIVTIAIMFHNHILILTFMG